MMREEEPERAPTAQERRMIEEEVRRQLALERRKRVGIRVQVDFWKRVRQAARDAGITIELFAAQALEAKIAVTPRRQLPEAESTKEQA